MLPQHLRLKHSRLHPVIHVCREIGDLIGQIDQLRLQRRLLIKKVRSELRVLGGRIIARVLDDAFTHAQREIQPAKGRITDLEVFDDPQRVQIVIEAQAKFLHRFIQGPLAGMPKRRMTNVMHQRQRFGHIFVQLERTGDSARNLRHLHGVGEPAAKVIGVAVSEDLGFARQAAKRPRVDHPRPVTLEWGTVGMGRLRMRSLRQQASLARHQPRSRVAAPKPRRSLPRRSPPIASGWRPSILPWPA